jgi:micrococcal nuclease
VGRGLKRLIGAALVIAVAVLGVVTALAASREPNLAPGEATIDRVVDGDTVDVLIGAGKERVRLLGINTPESVDPRKPVECYGKEASKRTAELLPRGTRVRLVRDVEARDKYGRLLAHIYRVDDGSHVNLTLAREGYARILTIPPNGADVAELTAAANEARAAKRGLWGACPAEVAR